MDYKEMMLVPCVGAFEWRKDEGHGLSVSLLYLYGIFRALLEYIITSSFLRRSTFQVMMTKKFLSLKNNCQKKKVCEFAMRWRP